MKGNKRAVIIDLTRGLYPIDLNGKITIKDLKDTIEGGTGDFTLGTTATTAAAGNHNHAIAADAGSGLAAAANLQAAFVALSNRVKVLEDKP